MTATRAAALACAPARPGRAPGTARGSVLVVVVLVTCALSVLVLAAGETAVLARRVQVSFERGLQGLYTAEAGLAHARQLCGSLASVAENPEAEKGRAGGVWDRWVPFGQGAYRVRATLLGGAPAGTPLSARGGGVLVEVRSRVGAGQETRIVSLLEDPPSCKVVAWWQPRS